MFRSIAALGYATLNETILKRGKKYDIWCRPTYNGDCE